MGGLDLVITLGTGLDVSVVTLGIDDFNLGISLLGGLVTDDLGGRVSNDVDTLSKLNFLGRDSLRLAGDRLKILGGDGLNSTVGKDGSGSLKGGAILLEESPDVGDVGSEVKLVHWDVHGLTLFDNYIL